MQWRVDSRSVSWLGQVLIHTHQSFQMLLKDLPCYFQELHRTEVKSTHLSEDLSSIEEKAKRQKERMNACLQQFAIMDAELAMVEATGNEMAAGGEVPVSGTPPLGPSRPDVEAP